MDTPSINLIVNALASGTTIRSRSPASKAVEDTYRDLEDTYRDLNKLIQQKLANRRGAKYILQQYEEKPEIWKAPLADELEQVHADQDEKITRAAQKLMELAKPEQQKALKHIATTQERLSAKFEQSLKEEKIWVLLSLGAAILGIFLLLTAGVIIFFTREVSVGVTMAIGGLVILLVNILSLQHRSQARKQLDQLYQQLSKVRSISLSWDLALKTNNDALQEEVIQRAIALTQQSGENH